MKKQKLIHKQEQLFKIHWNHRFSYGGSLRNQRKGRGARPLSSKEPLHLVFKANIKAVPQGLRSPVIFQLIHSMVKNYSHRFFVKVEQISIQKDHIHLLIRTSRRSNFQSFFRVVAGQIAQRVTGTFKLPHVGERFWKHRPFSRVVRGWRAYKVVRNYIQLNQREAEGRVPYRKDRLKGLTIEALQRLWA